MQDAQDRIRLARKVEKLHALGPRPLYEFLSELAGGDTPLALDIEIQLDRYARIAPGIVDQLGGRELQTPLVVVQGGANEKSNHLRQHPVHGIVRCNQGKGERQSWAK